MTGPVIHRELSRIEALHYIWWDQTTDPAVSNPSDVKAGHIWRNPTSLELKERDSTNTGWVSKGYLLNEAFTTLYGKTFVFHGPVPTEMTGGRRLVAGTNVTLSFSTPGEVIINATPTGGGAGLPGGGAAKEVLAKLSVTDFDVAWRRMAQLVTRSDIQATTATLANDASENVDLTGFGKSAELYKVLVSKAAWVVGYQTAAARTADAARTETTDPATAAGVLFEFITTGDNQTILCQPRPSCENHDAPVTDKLYLKIKNKSGGSAAITVTLTRVITEE